jgi:soluble lytic murein transglycosylase-like protein
LFALAVAVCPIARAAEHVILKNGFELDCARREVHGDHVRLFLLPAQSSGNAGMNYLDVAADAVARVEMVPDAQLRSENSEEQHPAITFPSRVDAKPLALTGEEMQTMLTHAGGAHNIDADLLASLVKAESGGHVRAVSRVGAQGLMQLMPTTAGELGVENAFEPEENIAGGTTYLDRLLTRYHNNVALALAAYNAGPAAVDRYHGVPPYPETRAYVARVIHEFNRRKRMSGVAEQIARTR